MAPKKRKARGGARAPSRSVASTPSIADPDSVMPDVDEENTIKASPSLKSPVNSSMAPSLASSRNRTGPHKEPVNDEWTDEQDTSLFKGLIKWKPVGMHRHFRMISLSMFLRNHGYDPEIETHTRPDGIWAHLEKYYDLETLGQREDHIDDDASDPHGPHQYIEFSLPEEDFGHMMFLQGKKNKQALQNMGDEQSTENENSKNVGEAEDEDWNSSPARFNPSASPPPISRKRKRGDTLTRTRGSTVEDTDDVSSVNSPAASVVQAASMSRTARSNKRATRAASGSRHASKDTTVDEEGSHIGDDDNGDGHEDETDDTASVKATTRSTAKRGKGGAPAKGQTTARKSGRKR